MKRFLLNALFACSACHATAPRTAPKAPSVPFHSVMTPLRGLLFALLALAQLVSASGRPEPTSAYLFAHFTGESPKGEQIYFSISEDGLNWTDLNNSDPVLLSNVGEKGVRDPSLLRTADGKRFILLATDLRIASGKGWGTATTRGSTSLVCWESVDLVNWSEPWRVDVAGTIPQAGCAWAPEAIYDEATDDYFVYWATISPRDGERKARIYGAHTKDFRNFTKPELYIARDGRDIIDTQIIEVKGAKHRYYRVSCDGQITFEAGDSLFGDWERTGDLAYLGYTNKQVEGPILFKINGQTKWGLLMDQYASGRGYLPFVTTDLDNSRGFNVLGAADYSLGISHKRHGGILNITRSEYEALCAKWPSQPMLRIAPVATPERFVRHANFKLRIDPDVRPAADACWRMVPGLAGGKDSLSIRSVNFPDRYITATAAGIAMEPNNGSPAYAARATFMQVPGLADPNATSFRLLNSPELYLREENSMLTVGPAHTQAERTQATFLIQ